MKFLQQVARYYIQSGADLSGMTMVFPNKRSAMFMRKYLKENMSEVGFMPRLVSVTYFIQQYEPSALGTPTELLFLLYKSYCDVLEAHGHADQIRDFDAFIFWGNVLLDDFNDVDSYMVDSEQLFMNIKDRQNIRANYLTESQLEVVAELWGGPRGKVDEDLFWEHLSPETDEEKASGRFIKLWEILGEVYHRFIERLDSLETPLAYSGLQSRRACDKIRSMTADDFGSRRFAFIGFNVLPISRILIFKHLRKLGIADFFWDTASPYFDLEKSTPDTDRNRAGRFILPLSKMFPMPDNFVPEAVDTSSHRVTVVSVPSNVAQTKVASTIVKTWIKRQNIPYSALVNTAIVLPDENLLMPLLYAIGPEVKQINVTMGVPFLSTPFTSLLQSIVSMQMRSRYSKGDMHYYYEDVLSVVSHPHVALIAPKAAVKIKAKIASERLYTLSADMLCKAYPELKMIFSAVADDKSIRQVHEYMTNLINGLRDGFGKISSGTERPKFYENEILDAYTSAIDELAELCHRYGQTMRQSSFFRLVERTLASSKIRFTGRPLAGLQIMGVMDTRVLDFDNLIILSMNERVFPRRTFTPSLIPASLRQAYEMPVQDHEEATYAYQFYRLISRASNVALLYDSRQSGLSAGEMSRYLFQLRHLDPTNTVRFTSASLMSAGEPDRKLCIEKTPDVIEDLRRFRPGGDLALSASAIKQYLKCPMSFYLQYVKRLRGEELTLEYIDPASYGSILHSMAETLYKPYMNNLIDARVYNTMLSTDLRGLAMRVLDRDYYRERFKGDFSRLPGEAQVLSKVMAEYVKMMLMFERDNYSPFTFVEAEMEEPQKVWRLADDLEINFTMKIDRVDRLDENTLRFIDYKTGSDATTASSVAKLFEEKKCHGMLQLLIYARAYADMTGFKGDIKPVIYKVNEFAMGIPDLKIGAKKNCMPIESHKQFADEFNPMLEEVIRHIFDEGPDSPFSMTENEKACEYCRFAQMCGRAKPKED